MKSKRFLCFALSAFLTLGLVGCGNKNSVNTKGDSAKTEQTQIKDGGTMIFSSSTDPTSLNPFFQQNRVTYTINRALFDPLFVIDKDETRYYLADSMEVSEDKLTYKIKLKDNLKWHDGEKITAEDLIYTVNVAKDEKQGIEDREVFIVDGKEVEMKKVDDLTVEFKLPQPYAPFDAGIGSLKIIPKHVFEGEADLAKSEKNNNPIGSGPFKFKEWKKGEMVTLERFDDYYSGKPHLDSVVYRIIPDANTSRVAFENGEISASYLTEERYEKFSQDSKFNTFKFEEGMLNYLVFNEKNENLKKKEVRQAICYALNKEELLKTMFKNLDNTQKAYSILTPNTKYYSDDVEKYDNNIEKAKELMKSAGVDKIKINFQYIEGDDNLVMMVKQQLEAIGIEIDPQKLDKNTFFAKMFGEVERDYDIIYNGYVMGNDPDGYSSAFTSDGEMNAQLYENKELDELWKQGAKEVDEAKRKEIYIKIQKTLAEDAVVYPIEYSKSLIGVDAKFGGIEEAKLVPIYMFEDLSKIYMKQE
ncbi:ABC transporter substrate-binding protein [Clostridium senegalense]|uniref:ABC transporter substrate-binding protein n=1 Tax=Clostridium senegalense TaxID=1465809 RepID=A0A6M0GZW6_9CLOT|nr:ABC transporter substrate-binding protein [Clostridium senegalense]NEU04080.1 ABC transporter substrate-binding protein [Clostridium senegalense]